MILTVTPIVKNSIFLLYVFSSCMDDPVGKCPLRIPGKLSPWPVMKTSLGGIQIRKEEN